MSNLKIYLPAVDGTAYVLQDETNNCKEAIHTLFTDDFAAPPRSMKFKLQLNLGK